MGQPVVHFEVVGQDGKKLIDYYSQLFGWEIDASNEMGYGIVSREGNTNAEGAGIGGGVFGMSGHGGGGSGEGHVTFYVEVPSVEEALVTAESLGGSRVMGPDTVPGGGPTLGQFRDPEGHLIGLVQSA